MSLTVKNCPVIKAESVVNQIKAVDRFESLSEERKEKILGVAQLFDSHIETLNQVLIQPKSNLKQKIALTTAKWDNAYRISFKDSLTVLSLNLSNTIESKCSKVFREIRTSINLEVFALSIERPDNSRVTRSYLFCPIGG